MRDPVLGDIPPEKLEEIKKIQRKLTSIANEATVVIRTIQLNGWEDGTCYRHAQNILSRAKSDSVRIARVIQNLEKKL